MFLPFKKMAAVLLLAGAAGLAGCGEYNHAKDLTLKEQERKPRVYGDPDGPARQLQNQYEADPQIAQKADAARHKLFGADYIFAETGNPVNDTMTTSMAPPLEQADAPAAN